MAIKHNLNKNDRVILTSLPSDIRPSERNPLWTSSFGCIGSVEGVSNNYTLVRWDNGHLGTVFIRRIKLFNAKTHRTEPNRAFFTKKRAERMDRTRMIFRKPATGMIRIDTS